MIICIPQGHISRVGADDKRIHARSDGHRPQVAGRVRALVLQILRPNQAEQVQEEPKTGAAVQQIRGTQCLAYLSSPQEEELDFHCTFQQVNINNDSPENGSQLFTSALSIRTF